MSSKELVKGISVFLLLTCGLSGEVIGAPWGRVANKKAVRRGASAARAAWLKLMGTNGNAYHNADHVRQVRKSVGEYGRQLGMKPKDLEVLDNASLLHDVSAPGQGHEKEIMDMLRLTPKIGQELGMSPWEVQKARVAIRATNLGYQQQLASKGQKLSTKMSQAMALADVRNMENLNEAAKNVALIAAEIGQNPITSLTSEGTGKFFRSIQNLSSKVNPLAVRQQFPQRVGKVADALDDLRKNYGAKGFPEWVDKYKISRNVRNQYPVIRQGTLTGLKESAGRYFRQQGKRKVF